jgi:hypothetical protein
MEAFEIHALFEIDLSRAWRLKGPVPFVCGFEIIFVNGKNSGFVGLFAMISCLRFN